MKKSGIWGQYLDPACWQVGEVWCLCQKSAHKEPQTCKTGLKFFSSSVSVHPLCDFCCVHNWFWSCRLYCMAELLGGTVLACFAPWITTLPGWVWNIKSHRIGLWKWVNSILELTPTELSLKMAWTCQPLESHTTQSGVREEEEIFGCGGCEKSPLDLIRLHSTRQSNLSKLKGSPSVAKGLL